jgi:type I restriction enzyme S subunit
MNVLLSVRPQYAEAIVSKKKKYELRRSVFKRKDIEKVYIYSTSPVSKIVGSFEVEEVIEDSPESIWNNCHEDLAISEDDFFRYFEGSMSAFAIKITNMMRFSDPLDPCSLIEDFRPPQSFRYLSTELHDEDIDEASSSNP